MDPDIILIIGIVLAILSVPSMLSAFSEGRAPRVGAFTAVLGGCMIVWAVTSHPDGYQWHEVPEVFVRVVARFL